MLLVECCWCKRVDFGVFDSTPMSLIVTGHWRWQMLHCCHSNCNCWPCARYTLTVGHGNWSTGSWAPSGQKGLTPESVRRGVRDSSYMNKRWTTSLTITNWEWRYIVQISWQSDQRGYDQSQDTEWHWYSIAGLRGSNQSLRRIVWCRAHL
jgi:hypothetical protein